jgi:hypothetical protein
MQDWAGELERTSKRFEEDEFATRGDFFLRPLDRISTE